MAIDPIFIAIEHLEDFVRAGGVAALSGETRKGLSILRGTTRVNHALVRAVKR